MKINYAPWSDLVTEQKRPMPFRSVSGKSFNINAFSKGVQTADSRSLPEARLAVTQPAPQSHARSTPPSPERKIAEQGGTAPVALRGDWAGGES